MAFSCKSPERKKRMRAGNARQMSSDHIDNVLTDAVGNICDKKYSTENNDKRLRSLIAKAQAKSLFLLLHFWIRYFISSIFYVYPEKDMGGLESKQTWPLVNKLDSQLINRTKRNFKWTDHLLILIRSYVVAFWKRNFLSVRCIEFQI